MLFFTFTNTVGFTKKPASRPSGCPSPPASTSAPSSMPLRIYDCTRSYCFCDTIGPMAVLGSAGSPTVKARIASRRRGCISLSRLLGTRRRVPAAQACPLFKKAMRSAAGIARSSAASSSRIVGDLPPSSSVTRFMVAAIAHDLLADADRAGEGDLVDVRITHELRAHDVSTADHDVAHALGELGRVDTFDHHLRLQRAQLTRFEDDCTTGGNGGCQLEANE